jgi:hypothetical protein
MMVVLGTLVLIGAFVFWCDLTDSWGNVFRRNIGALPRPVPIRKLKPRNEQS